MKAGRHVDALVAEHIMKEPKYWAVMFGGSHYGNLTTVAEAEAVAKQIQGDYKAHLYPYYDEPCYSTDIAAAWLVVEKLAQDGWSYNLEWKGKGRGYEFTAEGCLIRWKDAEHQTVHAVGDTVPLFICTLALRAVGVELPGVQDS